MVKHKRSRKKIWIGVIIILLIGIGFLFIFNEKKSSLEIYGTEKVLCLVDIAQDNCEKEGIWNNLAGGVKEEFYGKYPKYICWDDFKEKKRSFELSELNSCGIE